MYEPRGIMRAPAPLPLRATVWGEPPDRPRLQPGVVHVWRASLAVDAGCLAELLGTLSGHEMREAARCRFPEDRDRAIASRGFLRQLLASYLDRRPSDLVISRGPFGKPYLVTEDVGLHFSLAHSGGLALYAFTLEKEVGIDLQQSVPIDLEELVSAGFLSDGERRELLPLAGPRRQEALLRCWTRKEAYIKALGQGLSAPLQDIEVTVALGHAALLRTDSGTEGAGRWLLMDLDPAPGYAACVAWEREAALTCWAWSRPAPLA